MRKSIAEILAEAGSAKAAKDKVEILRKHNSTPLQTILKLTYDESTEFLVPDSEPPYKESAAHESQGMLYSEARRLRIFVKGGGYDNLNQLKRESLFIEMLEAVDKSDAKVLIDMITKRKFKGITKKVVEEAFPEMFNVA